MPGGWPGDHGNVAPIVTFPAFDPGHVIAANSFGLLTWAAVFCGEHIDRAFRGDAPQLGVVGAPYVLYDLQAQPYTSLVISPLDHFKIWVSHYNDSHPGSAWEMGVFSEVASLPANFSASTMLQAGSGGITTAMHEYGQTMRTMYGTSRQHAKDPVVNLLGYWTDNG